ncbi:hypothetical protein DYB38_007422 [Aphanomyces astaci]|uniref:FAD-binding PCMH-type domain-containing protein n=1 Tax=Aphanomyces astaci TaxID=112090 RepID=A0A397DW82_APHAT|nr:hypothetical protein DYB38_007422 [Aphanomyces astaci]
MAALSKVVLVLCAATQAATAWTNWDTRQACYPTKDVRPASVVELQAAVKAATSLRVAGAGHSFSPIVLTNATLLTLNNYASVVSFDTTTITVQAGMPLYAINSYLETKRRALPNLGAVAVQTAAGATQTGTHGTGKTGSISSGIVGMDLIAANGTILTLKSGSPLLDAARVGMGALGVVSTITFQHVPIWRMEQITFTLSLASFQQNLRLLQATYDRVQWYLYGNVATTQSVTVILRVNTTRAVTAAGGCWGGRSAAPTSPPPLGWSRWPAGAYACIDVSYKTLGVDGRNNMIGGLFTETELMIGADNDLQALTELLAVHKTLSHSTLVTLFLGMRYVEPDNGWLSPFYNRRTVVVSSIVYHSTTSSQFAVEIAPLHQAMHRALAKYDARPHPGKNNYFNATDMRRVYPKFQAFVQLQTSLDPTSKFVNPYISKLLHGPSNS